MSIYLVCSVKLLVPLMQEVDFREVEQRVVFFIQVPISLSEESTSGRQKTLVKSTYSFMDIDSSVL